ncbi:hypothetical protein PR202_gb14827 [Eleusine coracana subsp. coracana]|uniref:COBRA-like protein n=1 Tax=Eleusine coracana subsp. coracana TaxID=191504 RepID=A0AAV5EWD7_ELECO|nr:hypothetical protein PR202_gb14827 [Eleusine coracana subsp. coracana]
MNRLRLRVQVMVSIHNYQLYRHIEQPGWRLSWNWPGMEVIWDSRGAEATEQGDCKHVAGPKLPHCCERRPTMVDLPPSAPYTMQVTNCCRGGVLSSLTQNNATALGAFQMSVGSFKVARQGKVEPEKPWGFDLGVPGYTCSNATDVPPTRTKVDKRRYVQVLCNNAGPPPDFLLGLILDETMPAVLSCAGFATDLTSVCAVTWRVICSFSQYREAPAPSCCVSLSSFYNSTIVTCPKCSCACRSAPSSSRCVRQRSIILYSAFPGTDQSTVHALPGGDDDSAAPIVRCSDHMCPIRVHWHVKTNYRQYWRVKVTINNYNQVKNYSDWNLVMQHPNLQSLTQLFSFNYHPLIQYGTLNDTGMFWGVPNYNQMLLQDGNVQTEIVLKKDEGQFTFSQGWAFPRKIYFDGR